MKLQFIHYAIGPGPLSDQTLVHCQFETDAIDVALLDREAVGWSPRLFNAARLMGLPLDAGTWPAPEPDASLVWLGRCLATLGLAMQRQSGHVVQDSHVRVSRSGQRLEVWFEHEMAQFGEQAALLSLMLIKQALPTLDLPVGKETESADLEVQWRALSAEYRKFRMPGDTRALIDAAHRAGVPVIKLERYPYEPVQGEIRIRPNSMLMLGQGGHRHVLDGLLPLERCGRALALVKDPSAVDHVLAHHAWPRAGADESPAGGRFHLVIAHHRVAVCWDEATGAPYGGELAEEIRTKAEILSRDLDLGMLSISLRSPDPSQPLEANGGGVITLSPSPELDAWLDPDGEPMQTLMDAFMAWLFPDAGKTQLATLAVCGRQGATACSEQADRLLRALGLKTGLVNARGRALDGEWEDTTVEGSVMGHLRVFENPFSEALVWEANPLATAVNGFPFRQCPVAVCLGSSGWASEQPWLDNEDDHLSLLAGLLARASDGVVLKADDPNLEVLRKSATPARVAIVGDGAGADPAAGDLVCAWRTRDGQEWLALDDGGTLHWIGPRPQGVAADDVTLPAAVAAVYLLGHAPDALATAFNSDEFSGP